MLCLFSEPSISTPSLQSNYAHLFEGNLLNVYLEKCLFKYLLSETSKVMWKAQVCFIRFVNRNFNFVFYFVIWKSILTLEHPITPLMIINTVQYIITQLHINYKHKITLLCTFQLDELHYRCARFMFDKLKLHFLPVCFPSEFGGISSAEPSLADLQKMLNDDEINGAAGSSDNGWSWCYVINTFGPKKLFFVIKKIIFGKYWKIYKKNFFAPS